VKHLPPYPSPCTPAQPIPSLPIPSLPLFSDALEGRIQIVCVCPETINTDLWQHALLSPAWRDSVRAIVFDEVHMLDEGEYSECHAWIDTLSTPITECIECTEYTVRE
jgi:hypothetical protein